MTGALPYIFSIGGCGLLVLVFFWLAYRAGKNSAQAQEGQDNADAAARVADAESNAPVDLDDLRKRLRNGTRKL